MADLLVELGFKVVVEEDPELKASFPVTGEQLKQIFSGTPQSRCDEVAALLNEYSDKFEINTPLMIGSSRKVLIIKRF
ncbi:hypothetical protein LAG90_08640 [Marinilongibacter aquaticus]|uniref:hypothetical protein n=1 Tax=Marinilongibacter aquaticus TaxID=2975157 RepID=UPI0021BD9482|nr:hypothetical protein [Marinilongibacter aquaticus]UBM60701.1 hypothetical protein LAG90_08640 [Marinilongibacter aquaticus]